MPSRQTLDRKFTSTLNQGIALCIFEKIESLLHEIP